MTPHVDPRFSDCQHPHSWTFEEVMDEFEKGGFLQMMDDLNKTIELVV